MKFLFELHRSDEPKDQVSGLKYSAYEVRGEMDATSIYRVKEAAIRLMAIPGVYSLRIRNAALNRDWINLGPIDTRNPEQAAKLKKARKGSPTE